MNLPIIKKLVFNYNSNNLYVSVPFMVTKMRILSNHLNEQGTGYPTQDFHACINSNLFGYDNDIIINKYFTANLEYLGTQDIDFYQPVHINGLYNFKICDFITTWNEYQNLMIVLLVEFS